MSPRTSEQFEEIRDQKKKLITDTAMHLFATEGFYKTSISDIALKAGISKGLMYNYFESKESLLKAIVLQGLEEMFGLFDTNRDGKLSREELLYFVNQLFDLLQSKTLYWKLYFSIIAQPQVLKLYGNYIKQSMEPFHAIMQEFFRKQGSANPRAEAVLFYSLMDGVALNYILNPEGFPLEEIKKIIIRRFSDEKA